MPSGGAARPSRDPRASRPATRGAGRAAGLRRRRTVVQPLAGIAVWESHSFRAAGGLCKAALGVGKVAPAAGVTDADIDMIIDATIQYVAFGDPGDFNDDQWVAYMTDLVTNENLTEEELIDFLQYQQEGWTDWMINNPIEYENWLADYGDALETFSKNYLTTIE